MDYGKIFISTEQNIIWIDVVNLDFEISEEAGKKWGLSVLVLILPCAATFGLGSWQLVRREKKVGF